jgi:hypothetical protein
MVRWASVEGLVIPADWNADGQIRAVSILTNDEKEYRVDDSPGGRRLLRCLRKRVWATGWMEKDPQGIKHMAVEFFRLTSH